MKKILFITFLFCLSCHEQQNKNTCIEIKRKYDSILKLNKEFENSPFYGFSKILAKETGKASDSILIKEYKNLNIKDSLINLYVWERINTINQNINKSNIYKYYKGDYSLKPKFNKKNVQVTNLVIKNDSCYLYKNKELIVKGKFNLINSSNKYVKGKIRLERYKISFLDFSIKTILLDDNLCMDCEQLQFLKN